MLPDRGCHFIMPDGRQCRSPALKDERFCLFHSPEHQEEAAEIRRMGGLRRRKEKTVTGAYDLEGLGTVAGINRLLEIAVLDALSLENSLARSRTLGYLAGMALKCLEVSEFQARIERLEAAVNASHLPPTPAFDLDVDLVEDDPKELEP
jgi:hypothetical protein